MTRISIAVIKENIIDKLGKEFQISNILNTRELKQYQSINLIKKRDWLAGRVALKIAYSSFKQDHKINVSKWQVGNKVNGEPFIIGSKNLFYSLSHSYSWGVGVVSTVPIGVDIEKVRIHTKSFLKYITKKREIALLKDKKMDKNSLLTLIWTVKEAVSKATTSGIMINPKNVTIIACEDNYYKVRIKMKLTEIPIWKVYCYRVENYYITIAVPEFFNEKPSINWISSSSL